ncbi:LVIVD repeat-containing protein [Sphaerisporangium sp. NPDC049003]|uniref:LVIVD repeat-containing protein n=1 Tax=Sphaerisporangium sp. NPDC049003 TaxID=3364517 RepID=UPI0037114EF2
MSIPRRGGLAGRFLVLVGTAAALTLSAIPAQAADIPGTDQVVTSPNVQHVTNVPKPASIAATINTDIAFQGNYAYVGNYGGFSIYDIKNPKKTAVVSSVVCPGSQMDLSVYGDLLFASVDSSRNNDSCSSTPQPATQKESWEGIRIFDVSDKANPRYIKSVETNCGSHTHTLLPDKRHGNVYLYVSSYLPNAAYPDCQPPHDKISIVKVPLRDPAAAAVVATPVVFPDGGNETQPNLLLPTSGCHDITVYAEKGIAAGACMGDGVLFDIRNPEAPKVTARVTDPNFAFWHSATFNNAGTKVVFTDELGGGGAATCNEATGPNRGADAIYDIVNGHLVFKNYYKIPRYQADSENCVAHNGSLIPVKGRDIMVQAWYQGGASIWDFTDSAHPAEIGYFERGPAAEGSGGFWSAYYYNGYIYASDFNRGFDVIKINDRRTDPAARVRVDRLNAQTQGSYRDRGHDDWIWSEED